MFVGHYAVSFAIRARERRLPLWVLFVAVQFLDVLWAPLVLLGIEKVRIVPGITRTNPLDLYYMPYTHSLAAALAWSVVAFAAWRMLKGPTANGPATWVGVAVFSHWVLDLLVHRPDLALYDDTLKIGLGLWNYPALALALEVGLLVGGMWLYVHTCRPRRRIGFLALGVVAVGVHVVTFFGSPPPSANVAAVTALVAYALYAAWAYWLERGEPVSAP